MVGLCGCSVLCCPWLYVQFEAQHQHSGPRSPKVSFQYKIFFHWSFMFPFILFCHSEEQRAMIYSGQFCGYVKRYNSHYAHTLLFTSNPPLGTILMATDQSLQQCLVHTSASSEPKKKKKKRVPARPPWAHQAQVRRCRPWQHSLVLGLSYKSENEVIVQAHPSRYNRGH